MGLISEVIYIYQGAGKRPRQCCPKGPKTQDTATRGPEGPESAQNTRVRGPEGPEDEQSSVPVLALASATICFSRFGQKSRFSWHNLNTLMTTNQGAGKRPRQCCPKGPKTQDTATRGPEGPESAQNTRVRGPEGPEDEQSSVPVLALASATICFSRFGQKSRFSWHNLNTLMTTKMHENFSRV